MKTFRTQAGVKLYPLADRHPKHTRGPLKSVDHPGSPNIMAYNSGVKRPPKKGQWFLSGATPAAYKAPNDLTTAYYIAVPVRVIEKVIYTIESID